MFRHAELSHDEINLNKKCQGHRHPTGERDEIVRPQDAVEKTDQRFLYMVRTFDRHVGPFLLRNCGHFVPWEAPHALVSGTAAFCGDLLAGAPA